MSKSEPKATPSPWRLSVNRPCDIYGEDGRYIGTTYGNYERETPKHIFEEDKANAKLMAAAPELLEALIDMVNSCTNSTVASRRAFLLAHAAIEKAGGQS